MVNYLDTQSDAKRFAALLADYDRRLQALERSSQAAYTSIEGGTLDIYTEDGTLAGSVGVQPDGGIALVPEATAAVPPPTPGAPTVASALAGITVTWDGLWDDSNAPPTDFAAMQVHVGAASDFTPDVTTLAAAIVDVTGGSVSLALEGYDERWIRLVALNTAGLVSAPSVAVGGQARQAVEQDLVDGMVTELKLAENAVTEAKIAAGAVTTEKLTALAVTTDKLSALSVTADKLAVNSVTATAIAAGSVESTHIKAGAITAEKLDADAINGKVITGATVQTAVNGQRIVLGGSSLRAIGSNSATIGIEPNATYPFIYWSSADGTNRAVINVSGGASDANIGINSGVFLDAADGAQHKWRTWFGGDFWIAERVNASTSELSGARLRMGRDNVTLTSKTVRVAGVFHSDNIATGSVRITPVAGVPTAVTLSGGSLPGTTFQGFATAATSVPGTTVLGVGVTGVSSAGMTIWLTRKDAAETVVHWMIIGKE